MKKGQKGPRPESASTLKRLSKANTKTKEVANTSWIRIEKPFLLPNYVKEALQKINETGNVAYIVGGSVRDFVMNLESKDHDIATSATPDELCRIFPKAITVGKAFGVIKIPISSVSNDSSEDKSTKKEELEIATFREESDYKDYRHPNKVTFSTPEKDALRRDFTINSLFYDPKTQRILDLFNGIQDIKNKKIRAIGKQEKRFQEDALRLLRAVRFATTFGFQIEKETRKAIYKNASLIEKVSFERIRDEVNQMLLSTNPTQAMKLLSEFGILNVILPELEQLKNVEDAPFSQKRESVWRNTLFLLEILTSLQSKRSVPLCWAALLHNVGKPIAAGRSSNQNFNGHERDGAEIAKKICKRFKMSTVTTETVVALILEHLKFKDVFQMRESTLIRWLREPFFEELLLLHQSDAISSDGNLAYYEFCSKRLEEVQKTSSAIHLIDGEDLIQIGLTPSPQFSKILQTIEDLALEKKIKSKEEALEFVLKHFVN